MINGAIAVIINIILNFVLSRYLGIGGLALATSISDMVATVLLFVTLRRKIAVLYEGRAFVILENAAASLIMGVVAECLWPRWRNNHCEQGTDPCH